MAYYFTKAIKEEIGKKLERARRANRMKQIDVAVNAGVTASYYGRMERGLVNPSLEILYKVIKSLGVKSQDILPF